jgi:acyl carrier protein
MAPPAAAAVHLPATTMTRDEIFARVSRTMQELFELDAEAIRLDASLFDDLDLDSIDAVDMAAKMQEMTGRRVDDKDLRRIRTVRDIVDLVARDLPSRP